MNKEIFLKINNYNDYEISNYGRVKSLKHNMIRFLKPDLSNHTHTTYKYVRLSINGKTSKKAIHRLVGEHFVNGYNSKLHINHIDNNGLNNHYTNLEWVTHSENMIHAERQGRLYSSQSKGGKLSKVKYVENCLSEINKIYSNWKIIKFVDKKSHHLRVECQCILCKDYHELDLTYVQHNISKQCKSCSLKISGKLRREEKAKSLIGTRVDNWEVQDNYYHRTYKSKVGKSDRIDIMIDCKCNICNNIITRTPHQITNKIMKKCQTCNR